MATDAPEGRMVANLPTPFREDRASVDFLKAFEKMLLGRDDQVGVGTGAVQGIEETIELLPTYFVPSAPAVPGKQTQTPDAFLPWLASWMAFSMRADLPQEVRRDFVSNLATLYRWRGTRENLMRVLAYFTGLPSSDSTVAVSPTEPYCFEVRIDLSKRVAESRYTDVPRLVEIAHALIRREKPAHTRYRLLPSFPSFRLGSADGTGPFFAQVHGKDPADPNKDVGNTLIGIDAWEA